jgi:hypothetical protein
MDLTPIYPFWAIDKNYVINLDHVVWFQKHSDGKLTVCLSSKGPYGTDQIEVSDRAAIAAFITLISRSTK